MKQAFLWMFVGSRLGQALATILTDIRQEDESSTKVT